MQFTNFSIVLASMGITIVRYLLGTKLIVYYYICIILSANATV